MIQEEAKGFDLVRPLLPVKRIPVEIRSFTNGEAVDDADHRCHTLGCGTEDASQILHRSLSSAIEGQMQNSSALRRHNKHVDSVLVPGCHRWSASCLDT